MSQVFHGTIFSIPKELAPFSPEREARRLKAIAERDELQLVMDREGKKFQGNDDIPYVRPNDPIYRAIGKALEQFPT